MIREYFNGVGRPEAPTTASAEGLTSQRINVTWMTGFNGGSDQTFTLQIKQDGDANYTDVTNGKQHEAQRVIGWRGSCISTTEPPGEKSAVDAR